MTSRALAPRPPAATSGSEALRRLFGRGSVYTIAVALQMSSALLVVPVVTRVLSAKSYGTIAAAVVVFTTVSLVGAAGLPEAASRTFFEGERGPLDAHRLVAAIVVLAAGVALVADLTGPLWASFFSLRYSGVVRLAVWGGAAGSVMLGSQSLLRTTDRAWRFLIVSAVASVGAQLLGLGLTIAFRTPVAYMAGLTIGTAAAALVGIAFTRSVSHGLPGLRRLGSGLALGLPLIPHGLAVYLLASVDRIAIASVIGLAATGRYQVAYAIGGIGVALVTAMNLAWIPLLLGAEKRVQQEILATTSRMVHRFGVVVVGVLALAAPLGLLASAPASYGRDTLVPVSAIVAFSALPYATLSTYFNIVFMNGRTRVMAVAAPIAAAVNFALNLLLLPVVGLVGAAAATVLAYALLAAIIGVASRRCARPKELLGPIGWSWAAATPLVAAGALLPPTTLGAALRAVAVMVLLAVFTRMSLRLRSDVSPDQSAPTTPVVAPELASGRQPSA